MKVVNYLRAIRLEAGGVTRAVMDICHVLAARGHEVTLLTSSTEDVPEPWMRGRNGSPRVVSLRRRLLPLPRLGRAAISQARRVLEHADVLHLHGPWDPACAQLAREAEQLGVPYVVGLHGMLDEWTLARKSLKKRLYLALVGRRMLERARAVQCTAEGEREQSAPRFPAGRPVVVPLIFDLAPFRSLPGPERAREAYPQAFAGKLTILFVGRLHEIKRIELLLAAVALLDDLDVRVVIAGAGEPGYERALKARAEALGIGSRTTFAGFVSGDDKVSLYESADVFVLPSHHENWGFVAFEALACGTPVITTRDVISWPELERSAGALIVEPDAEAFARALRELHGDRERRAAMGEAGRSWVLRELELETISRQYETLYSAPQG